MDSRHLPDTSGVLADNAHSGSSTLVSLVASQPSP